MAGTWPEIEAMELPEFPQCVQTGLQLTQLLAMPFVTAPLAYVAEEPRINNFWS